MEAVTEFSVDLAWVVVVESTEGEGVVEQGAGVGGVDGGDGDGVVFAEVAAEGEVSSGVGG